MEDRLAAMVAAVLYTSDHIDLVQYTIPPPAQLPKGATDAQKREFQQQTKEFGKDRASAIEALGTAKAALLNPAKPTALNDYSKQQFIYHTPAMTMQDDQVQLIVESHDISEIDFDTVAIVLSGPVLVVACNYKIRSTVVSGAGRNTTHKITYKGFGQVSQTAIENVTAILMRELPQVARVKEVMLIGPATDPANEKANAAPHAEMQILSYLTKQNGLPKDGKLYFGVSKPCCSDCAGVLDKSKYQYREKASLKVTNWLAPEQIETKVLHSKRFD
jgi:hypothetical protein